MEMQMRRFFVGLFQAILASAVTETATDPGLSTNGLIAIVVLGLVFVALAGMYLLADGRRTRIGLTELLDDPPSLSAIVVESRKRGSAK